MRSEFEKYYKEQHTDKFCSVDAALEMRGDDYIDFHAADLWALWQHQQSKVDELTRQNSWLSDVVDRENKRANNLQQDKTSTTILLGKTIKEKNELQKLFDQHDKWLLERNKDCNELYNINVKHVAEKEELQKRVDAVVSEIEKLHLSGVIGWGTVNRLEQALKGGGE